MSNIIMLQNTFYVEVIIIFLLTVQVSCEKIFNRELHFLAIKFNFQIKGLSHLTECSTSTSATYCIYFPV